jgi:hypothetical protein
MIGLPAEVLSEFFAGEEAVIRAAAERLGSTP